MRKTTLEIDEQALDEARRILGTSSIKETVHSALREVAVQEARRRAVERLEEMRGLDLADPKIRAEAWRE